MNNGYFQTNNLRNKLYLLHAYFEKVRNSKVSHNKKAHNRLSVITPSLNQAKYIRETIDSVLNQGYQNVELIIIDGGSTDKTLEVLKSYGDKIRWVSEKDHGQSDAINKGLKMATGDIIAYLNSDDFYLPGAFLRVTEFFALNPGAKWVTGDYEIINEKGKRIQSFVAWYKKFISFIPIATVLSIVNFINQPSTFWKRELLNEIGLFDDKLHYTMDYDYWLRTIKIHPLYIIHKPLSAFRTHNQSKGGRQYHQQFAEEMMVISRYTRNPLILFLHKIHNQLTVFAYKILKG